MSGHRKSRGNPWFKVSIVLIPVAAISTGSLFAWFLFRTLFADRHTESAQSQPAENLQGIESLVRRGNAAIPELTAMLSSADPKTRRQALFGLSRLGPKAAEALPAVGDRLSDDDAKVRAMAFAAFEQICTDKEQVVIVAAKLLGDADAAVRESAAKTLESIPSFLPAANAIAKAVAEMVGHRQPATRIRAAQILHGRTSGDDAATNQLLRGLLSDPDLDVRTSAAGIVADRGGGSGDEIRVWLRDSNAGLVNKALGAVRCLCPDAVQTLPEIQALLDKAEGVQLDWVLSALRSLGDTAKPAAERLLQRVATMEPRRQLLASDVLLQIGAEPGAVTSLLATLVRSGDDDMARYAGQLLARASPDEARRQVAFIVAQIGDDRQWVAREDRRRLLEFTGNTGSQAGVNGSALHALSGMGPAAEEAVPLLIRLLASDEEWAQRDAAEALGGIGPPAASAVPALLAQIASLKPDSRHEEAVIESLGKIGSASHVAVPILLDILKRPEVLTSIRPYQPPIGEVATALGEIGVNSEEVLAALRRQLRNSSSEVRLRALHSLIVLSGEGGSLLPDLARSLADGYDDVRLLAELALAGVPGDRRIAISYLTTALNDRDGDVRLAAALALQEIGPDARAAVPTLRQVALEARNSVPNGRQPWSIFCPPVWNNPLRETRAPIPNWQVWLAEKPFSHRAADLVRLSVADAAQLALKAIDPDGKEPSGGSQANQGNRNEN